jgi:hypothetical protein
MCREREQINHVFCGRPHQVHAKYAIVGTIDQRFEGGARFPPVLGSKPVEGELTFNPEIASLLVGLIF